MSNFTAVFRLIAQSSGFQSTLGMATSAMSGLGAKLGNGLKEQVGKIFSVRQGFQMLKGTLEEVLNRAKQYNNLGQRMGIPAVEVQKLDKAAEAAGINVASLHRGMLLVQKFGSEAMSGTNKKAKTLASTLGATKEQLEIMARGGRDGLALLADLMQKVGDEGERDYIGLKILGEKWGELQQLMQDGGDTIRKGNKAQTEWSTLTQESLSRVQKAWANMWNDISVLAADLVPMFEPFLGIIRMLLNFLASLLRIITFVSKGFVSFVQTTLIAGAAVLADLFGDDESAKELNKQFEKKVDNAVKDQENFWENFGKDGEGFGRGLKMVFGIDTGEEGRLKKKPSKPKVDTRTPEEREAYDEALEAEEEKALATALTNAKEEEKLEILNKQLAVLRKQEEELKKKHPEKYKETKEYLELNAKLLEQERKIALQRRKDQKDLYEHGVSMFELAQDRRLARMKAAGASENEIQAEKVLQEKENAIRLAEELDALKKDKYASDDDRRKKALELAKQIGKAEDAIYEQQKKDKEAENEGGKATVSSLQAVGGGGAFAVTSMAARQLSEAQETNRLLQELVDLSDRNGLGAINAGTYGRPRI